MVIFVSKTRFFDPFWGVRKRFFWPREASGEVYNRINLILEHLFSKVNMFFDGPEHVLNTFFGAKSVIFSTFLLLLCFARYEPVFQTHLISPCVKKVLKRVKKYLFCAHQCVSVSVAIRPICDQRCSKPVPEVRRRWKKVKKVLFLVHFWVTFGKKCLKTAIFGVSCFVSRF